MRNSYVYNYRPMANFAGEYCIYTGRRARRSLTAVACKFHAFGKLVIVNNAAIRDNYGFAVEGVVASRKSAIEFNRCTGFLINISEVSLHAIRAVNIFRILSDFICIIFEVFSGELRKLNYNFFAAFGAEAGSLKVSVGRISIVNGPIFYGMASCFKISIFNCAATAIANVNQPTALAKGAVGISYFVALFGIIVLACGLGDVGTLNGRVLNTAVLAYLSGVALFNASRSNNCFYIVVTSRNVNNVSITAVVAYFEELAANCAIPCTGRELNGLHIGMIACFVLTIADGDSFCVAVAVGDGKQAGCRVVIELHGNYLLFSFALHVAEISGGTIAVINDKVAIGVNLHAINRYTGTTGKAERKGNSATCDAQQHKQLKKQ